MELTFNKVGNKYISEFEVTSDFNIHIERPEGGITDIYQKTSPEGEYAIVDGFDTNGKSVIDVDFTALVYPKWIRVVCGNKPTSAQIVTDGDVQQMKFQDKTVEIASNGTTTVTPDDGFTALGKVNVNVNVPSGEGGGTELEGEYFLAKPNGRYWKFTFSPDDDHYIDPYSLSEEQLEALMAFYLAFAPSSVIYGAAVCNADSPMDEDYRVDGVVVICERIGEMQNTLNDILSGNNIIDTDTFNSSFFRVWKECDIKSNPPVEIPNTGGLSLNSYNLVELMKMIYAMKEGSELTDDEAISIIEQMLMLVPATEEEYKAARREN